MLNFEDLIILLGSPTTDAQIIDLLTSLGISPKINNPKDRQDSAYAESNEHGIQLCFNDLEKYNIPNSAHMPEGTFVLSSFFLHRDGHQGLKEFKGRLPHDLSFAMTRNDIHNILGKPTSTSRLLPNDRWNFETYSMTIDFSKIDYMPNQVTIFIPKKDA